MPLKIYNTLTNSKDVFKPLEEGKISMYVCGMTVYDYCHIGHARVLVSFDMITRYLRSQNWEVSYVRNITDIDDKIINRANENGEHYTDLTERFIDAMHEDEKTLGVARPDQEPRATAYIQDIIDMIQVLIDKDYAYACDNGDVYYRVAKFEGYGKLSNKNSEDLLAGARVNVGDVKEDPRDFALWKGVVSSERGKGAETAAGAESAAAVVTTVTWDTPWGAGRPGWHIECSAMSKSCLGNTFDIHGGGPDLPFPHHENEIAQSEAANGCGFVNYWMHAGAVRVAGEKMSKSLGNFFTIRDVLKKYHPEVVRYLLISRHYRSAINYSEGNLVEARTGLERFYTALRDFSDVAATPINELGESAIYQRFVEAMNDDFNTSVALAAMYDLVRDLNTAAKAGETARAQAMAAELKAMGTIFGILQSSPEEFLQAGGDGELDAAAIETLIAARVQAKADKNWGRCDEIRDELKEQGVVLEDSSEGTQWRRE